MKTNLILRGFHRPLLLIPPLMRPLLVNDVDYIIAEKRIIFTESCRYALDCGDQEDWNKLFGFCFGIFGIHRNSARAVWRYNTDNGHIEIALYTYVDGERKWHICTSVPIDTICEIRLLYMPDSHQLTLLVFGPYNGSVTKNVSFPIKRAYSCGLYFGGNRTAPHNIKIYEY